MPAEATRYLYLNQQLIPEKNFQRGESNVQNWENGLGGFDGTIHRSRKLEEYVRGIMDHVRFVVARLALYFKAQKVRT